MLRRNFLKYVGAFPSFGFVKPYQTPPLKYDGDDPCEFADLLQQRFEPELSILGEPDIVQYSFDLDRNSRSKFEVQWGNFKKVVEVHKSCDYSYVCQMGFIKLQIRLHPESDCFGDKIGFPIKSTSYSGKMWFEDNLLICRQCKYGKVEISNVA
jgi:hypothetical protein